MTADTVELPTEHLTTDRPTPPEPVRFANWFSRCHTTLYITARLILGDSEKAERAVRNCRIGLSRISSTFHSEGAFHSWILRRLISEALAIRDRA